ncbi:MAG: hypothetical protein V4549_13955 [Bacteroidota bacterium]
MDFIKTKGVLIAVTIFSLTLGEVWGVVSFAQNVGINTTGNAPNSSALLDINASPGNNKGILIPRLPLTATNSGTPISPLPGVAETGLMVFNTATAGVPPNDVIPGFYYWNGTAWAPLGGGSTAGGWTDDGTVVRLTTSTDFVGIGTASPAATSALDIASTTKGLLIPRMTTAQRDAISTPAIGLQIYNTDCKVVDYWSGSCWISMSKSLPSPGAITSSGTTVFCAGQSRTYTIAAIAGATSYTWTVPAGTTINSGQGTVSISATFGNISGSVCVNANNACETSGQSCLAVSVDPIPNTPGNITGPSSINPGQQSVNYFIASVNGASAYTWAYSGTGLTIASGTGTTSIVVNFACNATAGNLTVTANSTCGASTASSLALTVTPLLAVNAGAGVFAGATMGNTATGGTGPYTYGWGPTGDLSSSSTAVTTAQCTGITTTYTLTATDSRSCIATSTVLVTRDLTTPTAGTHTPSTTQIVWNWIAGTGTAGYKWNTTNNYGTATDNGASTSKTETGLTSGTTYTRYVWAYNSNGCVSSVLTLIFTTSGQISYTATGTVNWTCPVGVTSIGVLVVAGGGSGGNHNTTNGNGGGGGGGLIFNAAYSVTPGNVYTVTVGAGGARIANATCGQGNNGQNSVFGTLTAIGGGGGGSSGCGTGGGKNGGSGGGAAYPNGNASSNSAGTGVGGQGFAGGASAITWSGAGGGGYSSAGVIGGNAATNCNGGAGYVTSFSGSSVGYAGGGGGGGNSSEHAGDGYDGGGRGEGTTQTHNYNSYPGGMNGTTRGSNTPDAIANTGGGGGGGSYWACNGGWCTGSGQGGSGIVIIKW